MACSSNISLVASSSMSFTEHLITLVLMLSRNLCHTLTLLACPLVFARFMVVSTVNWRLQKFFMFVHTTCTSCSPKDPLAFHFFICGRNSSRFFILRLISTPMLCLRTLTSSYISRLLVSRHSIIFYHFFHRW
jgi:hypothetical protein